MSEVVLVAIRTLEELAQLNNATWWKFEKELRQSPYWLEIEYRLKRLLEGQP